MCHAKLSNHMSSNWLYFNVIFVILGYWSSKSWRCPKEAFGGTLVEKAKRCVNIYAYYDTKVQLFHFYYIIAIITVIDIIKMLICRLYCCPLGFYVENLFLVDCEELDDLLAVLEEGMRNRSNGSHAMNENSSRSHTILTGILLLFFVLIFFFCFLVTLINFFTSI